MGSSIRAIAVVVALAMAVGRNPATQAHAAADEPRPLAAWARHVWQSRDGLPEGPITAIVPLGDGTVLVGGQTGRCRLDGDRVRPLVASDPQSAKLDDVPLDPWLAAGRAAVSPCTSRCRTADGTVFAGFLNGPPLRGRGGKEHRFRSDEGVRSDTSSHVATDAQGHVWLAQNGLLAEYDAGLGRFVARAELPAGRITIAPGRDGGLWIKINTQVFRYRDGAGLSMQAGNAPHGFTVLYEDSQERLWVGSDFFGLYLLADGSFAPVATVGEGVFAIADDQEGGLWVGTSTAANRLWPAVMHGIVATESGMQLPNSLCEDGAGRFWLATESGWLGRIEPDSNGPIFRRCGTADGWNGIAHCVAAGPEGEIFVGTRNDGIHRYDGAAFAKVESSPGATQAPEFGEYRIEQLLAARCGDLWAAIPDGLFRYRNERWMTAVVEERQTRDLGSPKALIEDHGGTVWVATAAGSLCRFAAGGGADAEGEVVAVGSSGTARVSALAATPDGAVWAAVRDDGLLRIRDGRVDRVGVEAGLPSAGIVALAADTTGLLWCVTSRLICAASLAELDAIAEGKQSRLHPWVFSGEDEGVEIDPADRPHCQAIATRDGKIWIPLRRGLAIIDPSRLGRLSGPPTVAVEEVRVAGQPVAMEPAAAAESNGRRVTLAPDPRGIEIEIGGRGLARPANARMLYRLEGFDADWRASSNDRLIRYERLPAGRYTLRLRSEHDRGAWENGPRAFVLDVQPQLWERGWFRVVALAAVATIAAAAAVGAATVRHRARLSRIEQQAALEEQRMRIARDMHDEAGTTATQLALLADLARSGSGDGPARAERLEGVARIARQLVTSLDEMVWAVNPTNDTLAHLVSYLGQTASATLGRFEIACRVRAQEPLPDCMATAELRRGMLLIAKEAVSNVVEHAGASVVEIELSVHDDRLRMTITDDGRGLPEQTNGRPHGPGGNGLGNMRSRAADLGGSCRIEPVPPLGTRVVVEVPLFRETHA